MRGKMPGLKASTRRTYADALDHHVLPELGRYYVDAIRPADIREWFAAKAEVYAPATVNGFLRVLKTMMADASEELDIPDPTRRIKAARQVGGPSTRRNMLTADEMGSFLEVLRDEDSQWYAMVFTQFATATRFGEVSALRWEDIDEQAGVIRIVRSHWRTIVDTTKTNEVRVVALTSELRDVLRWWRRKLLRAQDRQLHSGWIFPARTGKPHHAPSCMRPAFERALEVINVDRRFSSHGLRRTANDLLRRVATGEVTRSITGHATASMTDRYSHVETAEKATAVTKMLKLVHDSGDQDGGGGAA